MKPSHTRLDSTPLVVANRRALHAASLLLAVTAAACGGAPPPEPVDPLVAALNAPTQAAPVPAAPAQTATAAAGPDKAAVAQCLAAAGAKRAKFSGEPPKIGVRHLLVKHKGSKNADASIKRTREEACLRAAEARDKVRGGADFVELVKEYSDDPSAKTMGGSLGTVERKDLMKPFADAAFELAVNQLSDVVETESGFHLIIRTE